MRKKKTLQANCAPFLQIRRAVPRRACTRGYGSAGPVNVFIGREYFGGRWSGLLDPGDGLRTDQYIYRPPVYIYRLLTKRLILYLRPIILINRIASLKFRVLRLLRIYLKIGR